MMDMELAHNHANEGQSTSSSLTPEALLDLACEAGSKGEFPQLEKHCAAVLAIPHDQITPVFPARACWWQWQARTQQGDRAGRRQALDKLGEIMKWWKEIGFVNCDSSTPSSTEPQGEKLQVEQRRYGFFHTRWNLATLADDAFSDPTVGNSAKNPIRVPDVDNEYKFLSYIPCPGGPGGQAKDGRYECIGQALVQGMDRLTCKYVPTDPTAKDAPTDTSKPETASFSTGIQVASGEKSRDFWFYGFDIGAGLF